MHNNIPSVDASTFLTLSLHEILAWFENEKVGSIVIDYSNLENLSKQNRAEYDKKLDIAKTLLWGKTEAKNQEKDGIQWTLDITDEITGALVSKAASFFQAIGHKSIGSILKLLQIPIKFGKNCEEVRQYSNEAFLEDSLKNTIVDAAKGALEFPLIIPKLFYRAGAALLPALTRQFEAHPEILENPEMLEHYKGQIVASEIWRYWDNFGKTLGSGTEPPLKRQKIDVDQNWYSDNMEFYVQHSSVDPLFTNAYVNNMGVVDGPQNNQILFEKQDVEILLNDVAYNPDDLKGAALLNYTDDGLNALFEKITQNSELNENEVSSLQENFPALQQATQTAYQLTVEALETVDVVDEQANDVKQQCDESVAIANKIAGLWELAGELANSVVNYLIKKDQAKEIVDEAFHQLNTQLKCVELQFNVQLCQEVFSNSQWTSYERQTFFYNTLFNKASTLFPMEEKEKNYHSFLELKDMYKNRMSEDRGDLKNIKANMQTLISQMEAITHKAKKLKVNFFADNAKLILGFATLCGVNFGFSLTPIGVALGYLSYRSEKRAKNELKKLGRAFSNANRPYDGFNELGHINSASCDANRSALHQLRGATSPNSDLFMPWQHRQASRETMADVQEEMSELQKGKTTLKLLLDIQNGECDYEELVTAIANGAFCPDDPKVKAIKEYIEKISTGGMITLTTGGVDDFEVVACTRGLNMIIQQFINDRNKKNDNERKLEVARLQTASKLNDRAIEDCQGTITEITKELNYQRKIAPIVDVWHKYQKEQENALLAGLSEEEEKSYKDCLLIQNQMLTVLAMEAQKRESKRQFYMMFGPLHFVSAQFRQMGYEQQATKFDQGVSVIEAADHAYHTWKGIVENAKLINEFREALLNGYVINFKEKLGGKLSDAEILMVGTDLAIENIFKNLLHINKQRKKIGEIEVIEGRSALEVAKILQGAAIPSFAEIITGIGGLLLLYNAVQIFAGNAEPFDPVMKALSNLSTSIKNGFESLEKNANRRHKEAMQKLDHIQLTIDSVKRTLNNLCQLIHSTINKNTDIERKTEHGAIIFQGYKQSFQDCINKIIDESKDLIKEKDAFKLLLDHDKFQSYLRALDFHIGQFNHHQYSGYSAYGLKGVDFALMPITQAPELFFKFLINAVSPQIDLTNMSNPLLLNFVSKILLATGYHISKLIQNKVDVPAENLNLFVKICQSVLSEGESFCNIKKFLSADLSSLHRLLAGNQQLVHSIVQMIEASDKFDDCFNRMMRPKSYQNNYSLVRYAFDPGPNTHRFRVSYSRHADGHIKSTSTESLQKKNGMACFALPLLLLSELNTDVIAVNHKKHFVQSMVDACYDFAPFMKEKFVEINFYPSSYWLVIQNNDYSNDTEGTYSEWFGRGYNSVIKVINWRKNVKIKDPKAQQTILLVDDARVEKASMDKVCKLLCSGRKERYYQNYYKIMNDYADVLRKFNAGLLKEAFFDSNNSQLVYPHPLYREYFPIFFPTTYLKKLCDLEKIKFLLRSDNNDFRFVYQFIEANKTKEVVSSPDAMDVETNESSSDQTYQLLLTLQILFEGRHDYVDVLSFIVAKFDAISVHAYWNVIEHKHSSFFYELEYLYNFFVLVAMYGSTFSLDNIVLGNVGFPGKETIDLTNDRVIISDRSDFVGLFKMLKQAGDQTIIFNANQHDSELNALIDSALQNNNAIQSFSHLFNNLSYYYDMEKKEILRLNESSKNVYFSKISAYLKDNPDFQNFYKQAILNHKKITGLFMILFNINYFDVCCFLEGELMQPAEEKLAVFIKKDFEFFYLYLKRFLKLVDFQKVVAENRILQALLAGNIADLKHIFRFNSDCDLSNYLKLINMLIDELKANFDRMPLEHANISDELLFKLNEITERQPFNMQTVELDSTWENMEKIAEIRLAQSKQQDNVKCLPSSSDDTYHLSKLATGIFKRPSRRDFFQSVLYDNVEKVRQYVEKYKFNIESRDIYDRTPLMIAIGNRNNAVARYLIDKGADCNACANAWDGCYGLHYASYGNNQPMYDYLMEHCEDKNPKNKRGFNPISPNIRQKAAEEVNEREEKTAGWVTLGLTAVGGAIGLLGGPPGGLAGAAIGQGAGRIVAKGERDNRHERYYPYLGPK